MREHYRTLMLKGKYNLAFAEKDYDLALEYAQELRGYLETGFDTLPLCYAYFYKKEYNLARRCALEHDKEMPGQPSLNYMIGYAYLKEEELDAARHYFSLA